METDQSVVFALMYIQGVDLYGVKMQPLRTRRDYGEKEVNPYLNTPPTKLKEDIGKESDSEKKKLMKEALNAWRLTTPGPFRKVGGTMDVQKIADRIASKMVGASMKEEVIKFLTNNPNPDDEKVHAFAEEKGYDIHKLEAVFYGLATKFANFATEGKSVKDGFTVDDIDPKELELGRKVEKEHASDPEIIDRIILDHCAAVKDYYSNPKAAMKDLEEETKA